jgi:hypothetical protein
MLAATTVLRFEDVGMKLVDDEASLFLVKHQTNAAQHAQVMGNVDDVGASFSGNLGDVARSLTQAVDDPQPLGVGQRLQQSSATLGFKRFGHGRGTPPGRITLLAYPAFGPASASLVGLCL